MLATIDSTAKKTRDSGTPKGRIGAAFAAVWGTLALSAASFCFGADPTIELRTGKRVFLGKVAVQTDDECWLMGRDGRLHCVPSDQIESRRQVNRAFHGLGSAELRDQLRRELGGHYDVTGTEHYLVCATKGASDRYAPMFEEVYRSFRGHFSVRGFSMRKPEFPLVAVVHPGQAQFAQQCREDRVPYVPGLLGYYHPASNRVSVYVQAEQPVSHREDPAAPLSRMLASADHGPFPRPEDGEGWGRFAGRQDVRNSLKDTIVHETAHQVAFNCGLHPRLGETPRWIVEGLATVYEAPGIREGGGSREAAVHRMNRERFMRFGNFVKSRRRPDSLKSFLSNDEMLHQSPLDFYAQAWALTFFLVETRPAAYNKYLQAVADRNTLFAYSEKDRVHDFEKAFGREIPLLEAEFLRYLQKLQTP